MTARLAYVLSRFPLLSETFILREVLALGELGRQPRLYAITHQRSRVRHPEAAAIEPAVRFLSPLSGSTLRANARALVRDPRGYTRMVATVLGNWPSPDFLLKGLAIMPGVVAWAEEMRRSGVGHIHAHYGTHPALAAMLAARHADIGYSFTVHAHDLFVDTTMLAEKIRQARFVVTISEYNRRRIGALAGPDAAAKVVVVRCGVDPAMLEARDWRPPADGPARILTVASLQEYKGLDRLIAACGLLRDRGVAFVCEVVGEGPLRASLERLIARLGLREQVRLLGPRDQHDVRARMARASVYVQPSVIARDGQMEGIPVALMEAMASGVPVVASALSGIPELVRHGETGLLVPPGQPTALCDAILACLTASDDAVARARRARALIESSYDLRQNAKQLAALFDRALGHPNPGARGAKGQRYWQPGRLASTTIVPALVDGSTET
jgi:glycosyltransferase involved in cell wall biosynthesis